MDRKRLKQATSGYNKYSGVRITMLSSELRTREQMETQMTPELKTWWRQLEE